MACILVTTSICTVVDTLLRAAQRHHRSVERVQSVRGRHVVMEKLDRYSGKRHAVRPHGRQDVANAATITGTAANARVNTTANTNITNATAGDINATDITTGTATSVVSEDGAAAVSSTVVQG